MEDQLFWQVGWKDAEIHRTAHLSVRILLTLVPSQDSSVPGHASPKVLEVVALLKHVQGCCWSREHLTWLINATRGLGTMGLCLPQGTPKLQLLSHNKIQQAAHTNGFQASLRPGQV